MFFLVGPSVAPYCDRYYYSGWWSQLTTLAIGSVPHSVSAPHDPEASECMRLLNSCGIDVPFQGCANKHQVISVRAWALRCTGGGSASAWAPIERAVLSGPWVLPSGRCSCIACCKSISIPRKVRMVVGPSLLEPPAPPSTWQGEMVSSTFRGLVVKLAVQACRTGGTLKLHDRNYLVTNYLV